MEQSAVRLATFNLHNLGRGDYRNPLEYADKLDRLVAAIRGVKADLVAVQEVREPACFEELAGRLAELPFRTLADAPAEERNIQIGILTRLPVVGQGQWRDYPALLPGARSVSRQRFRRPVPWVKARLGNGATLLAAAVHLKSRRPETEAVPDTEVPLARAVLGRSLPVLVRVMEASGLRCLLDEQMAAAAADHYAVLGDFNDRQDSEAVYLAQGTDETRSGAESGAGRRLVSALAVHGVPAGSFSYCGSSGCELIDHILVNRDLALRLEQAGVESQLLVDEGASGSDHAPVWAEFSIGGEAAARPR